MLSPTLATFMYLYATYKHVCTSRYCATMHAHDVVLCYDLYNLCRVNPSIIGHYHILDNNNEKFSHAKNMHRQNLRKILVQPSTIGYMYKEFQGICSNYDGGSYMAHSELYSNKHFLQFLRESRNLST